MCIRLPVRLYPGFESPVLRQSKVRHLYINFSLTSRCTHCSPVYQVMGIVTAVPSPYSQYGITFIFVTHDQGEALSMSDRVAVFNNGRIEQVDSPRDLYMRPRTPFVAGFVGTSNVFDGLMAEKLCGMTGSFALRPEHIRLNTPGELQANGTIQAVQYQGAATRFELKLNGGEKLLVSQANMTGEELPATLTPGQQVMVSWSRDVMVPLVEER